MRNGLLGMREEFFRPRDGVSPVRNEDAEELAQTLWGKLMRELQRR